jgi:hypothetical protein
MKNISHQPSFVFTVVPITVLLVALASTSRAAKIDNALGRHQTQSCSVRLSNMSLRDGDSGIIGQEFCSGTMINSKQLVTAAHCLNLISSASIDLTNVKNHPGFELSVGSSNQSQKVKIENGRKSFSSAAMFRRSQRQSYIDHGNGSLINLDLAVVTLESPVQEIVGRSCPRLPTEGDCAAFQSNLAETSAAKPARSPAITAYYYESRIVKSGDGAGAERDPALTSQIYLTRSVEMALRGGYAALTFTGSDQNGIAKVVHLLKGDSGTAALWNSGTGDVVVGVQSGLLREDGHAGFAQVCSHLKTEEWVAALGPAKNEQTASVTPVTTSASGSGGSGSSNSIR